jgi:hypothetical protein
MIKIAIGLVIVAVVGRMLYGPSFLSNFQNPIEASQKFAQSTIQPLIKSELENATFTYDPATKQYIIQNKLFKLEGFSDQDKADIIIKGKKHTIDATLLKSFIEKQIAQQSLQQNKII